MSNTIININATDSDLFKEALQIIKDILEDSRVPGEVKKEIKERVQNTVDNYREE